MPWPCAGPARTKGGNKNHASDDHRYIPAPRRAAHRRADRDTTKIFAPHAHRVAAALGVGERLHHGSRGLAEQCASLDRPGRRNLVRRRRGGSRQRASLRVGIFNIHGGRGQDKNRDLARTAECLRGLDLVGMNEVLGPKLWWQTDQCQQLGELLGVSWLFAPTDIVLWDGSFGNGLLCRLPVSAWQRIPLPRAGAHTYRNAVFSTIDVGAHTVRVLLTHLDSRDAERRHEQMRMVGELFLSLAPPAILMGDMNTFPGDPQLDLLLARPGVVDAVAAGMAEPPLRRMDWILTAACARSRPACEDHGASDIHSIGLSWKSSIDALHPPRRRCFRADRACGRLSWLLDLPRVAVYPRTALKGRGNRAH